MIAAGHGSRGGPGAAGAAIGVTNAGIAATLVTIAIPTHDQREVVAEAIASALAQSWPHLEVLVMDDASTDGTAAVVDAFVARDPRVRSIRHPVNIGRVANYRAGLAAARGAWLLTLDGDDRLVDERFVEDSLRHAAPGTGVVLALGGMRMLESDGRHRDLRPTPREAESLDGWIFFLRWRSPDQVAPHFGALIRTDVARAIGFYTENILSADWESLRRLCLQGRVVLLPRIAGEWRGHAGNASRSLDPTAHVANLAAILEPWQAAVRAGHDGPALRAWKRDALRNYAAAYLEAALTLGDLAAARSFSDAVESSLGRDARGLIASCWRARPSLWLKLALLRTGGRSLLARAQRLWHRATWRRGR